MEYWSSQNSNREKVMGGGPIYIIMTYYFLSGGERIFMMKNFFRVLMMLS
jgi:hypothetical protein